MSMYAKPSLEGDVSLAQIWQTLSCNRWLFGLILAVFMIAGYVLWLVLPPTYQARVQINVGKTNVGEVLRSDFFEQPGDLIVRLMSEYGQIKADGTPALKVAKLRRGATSTVELVAEGREQGATQAFLENITKGVLEGHQQIYDRNVAALTAQLQALDNHQQALEEAYTEVSLFINQNLSVPKADSVQLALFSIQRSQLGQLLTDLDMRRPVIISNLSPPLTYPTVQVGEIDVPNRPVAPKRALIMAAAAILGMIFSVLAAFCWGAARADRSPQPTA